MAAPVHEHYVVQPGTNGHEATLPELAVIPAGIVPRQAGVPFQAGRHPQRNMMLLHVGLVFGWVELNLHTQ